MDIDMDKQIRDFRDATVSFGIDTTVWFLDVNGQKISRKIYLAIGTGVAFYLKSSIIPNIPCIVTARHVLKDVEKIRVRFPEFDSLPIDKYYGIEYQLKNPDGTPTWFGHPDSSVDLACIVFDTSFYGKLSTLKILPYSIFPDIEDYYEGKEIFALGYPGAVGFELLNRAVLRKGIISWLPADIRTDNKRFLIDCSIFPGNSGGPIFSLAKGRGYIMTDTISRRSKFFGIVSERRFSNISVMAVNGQPVLDRNGNRIIGQESIGIGVVESSFKVRELLASVQTVIDKYEATNRNEIIKHIK
jgi:hypothetical protein